MTVIGIIVGAAIVACLAALLLFKWFLKVPRADQALVITGWGTGGSGAEAGGRTFKVVTGGGALVIPVIQRAQYITLKALKASLDVEGYDSQKIPVGVTGSVVFKVGDDQESITNAVTRFLDSQEERHGAESVMLDLVKEVFHGHLRSIIGGLTVEDLIANRNALAIQARDASMDEVSKLGLVVDSVQIQHITDPTGYITALGEPRAAEVKMNARIADANRNREATEREQEAEALRAAAMRETAIKRAQYQAEQDKAEFTAQQAGPLADAEARKAVVERETEVARLEADREQQRLIGTVNKQADADAYVARTAAQAERDTQILRAEAQAQQVKLSAQADAERVKLEGQARAEATRLNGVADADALRAKGLAEADAIQKRGEALQVESDAVIEQQIAVAVTEKLPDVVRAAASAFDKVDQFTVLNGSQGVMDSVTQIVASAGPMLEVLRASMRTGTGNGHGNGHKSEDIPVS